VTHPLCEVLAAALVDAPPRGVVVRLGLATLARGADAGRLIFGCFDFDA
jgi:hypothetical protein